jgi:hypothetical protein
MKYRDYPAIAQHPREVRFADDARRAYLVKREAQDEGE